MAKNHLSVNVKEGRGKVGSPSLVDSQERDVPSSKAIATSSSNSTSNAPAAINYPGNGLGGSELLVENVIELGDPTLITHEVTHGIWFAISKSQ